MDVWIVRDPRESTRKCSLTPVRGLPNLRFSSHLIGRRVDVGQRILLHPEGDELTSADRGQGLLLVDCAWRRVPELLAQIDGALLPRRLPPLTTAYPRASHIFQDPASGLASIEALYAALCMLGNPRPELLRGYHWAKEFLSLNQARLCGLAG